MTTPRVPTLAIDDELKRKLLFTLLALVIYRVGAHIAAPGVSVIDTVGAGDTFQAASLTWLAENDLLNPGALAGLDAGRVRALLQFAAHSAAITCSRRGADLPRRAEVGAA